MPSLFSAVIQPERKKAQAKARKMVRSASHSFRGNPKDATRGKDGSGENGTHGYQPNRAEQKAMRLEQKRKDIEAGVLVLNDEEAEVALREKSSKPVVMRTAVKDARFGVLEHSGRGVDFDRPRDTLASINEDKLGQTVFFRARVHGTRPLSAKLGFIIFRDGITTIQGVVRAGAGSSGSDAVDPTARDAQNPPASESMSNTVSSSATAATATSLQSPNLTAVGTPEINGHSNGNAVANGNDATYLENGGDANVHLATATKGENAGPANQEDFGLQENPNAQTQQKKEEKTGPPGPPEVQDENAAAKSNNPNDPYSSSSSSSPPKPRRRGSISSLPSSTHAFTNLLTSTSSSGVTEEMVRWCEKLPLETLVYCEGIVRRPEDDSGGKVKEVKSVEVGGVEIEIQRLLVVSQVTNRKPFAVSQAAADESQADASHSARVGFHSLLAHPALSLRTPVSHAIFRLIAACSRAARSYLDERDFTEIHSSKFQAAGSESGASVFVVDYFRRQVTLAQSPQLAKEMCIGADFGKVYEIGPVFRAEHSNTHRHLCEFTGLDVEMAIDSDYHEAMYLIDGLLKHIFRTVQERNRAEIEVVKTQFPSEDLVFPDETVVLKYKDGIRMLRESGYRDDHEPENVDVMDLPEMEDLSTKAEVRLGQLVKEKYNTDYYILDKFPAAVRPFYTMPDADDPTYSNSFDIFVRGEEILSGGQRLHHAPTLEDALEKAGIAGEDMREYLEAFQFAMPPHAGGGIGLERLVMLFLKLGNIRYATLLPRDPRSFLDNPSFDQRGKARPGRAVRLPVPDGVANWDEPNVASKDPMFQEGDHPGLEGLIAKYGDSTNTAWTDPGYEIYRHPPTGYAVGFVPAKGHAVTWGAPLCPADKLSLVIREYIKWCHDERKLGPIWANADEKTEEVLVKEHHWRALAVTSEQRIDPSAVLDPSRAGPDSKHIEKKVRQGEAAGVTVKMIEGEITQELREEIEEGMQRWLEGRKGAQIHTTSLRPWADVEHRTYFIARDKEQKACGMIVLEQLAPEHGFQIKWSLMFPGAPNGTSEMLITTAMRTLVEEGVTTATFGAGAKDTLDVINGIGNTRGKILSHVYKGISKTFGLTRKSHFREKFGAEEDPLYICYPAHGLGIRGISAIMESVNN